MGPEIVEEDSDEGIPERFKRSSNATESERAKRQADSPGNPKSDPKKEDVCESKVEIVTPYWASNSNGKVRAIMNNKEFEQAIHQEICRCNKNPFLKQG